MGQYRKKPVVIEARQVPVYEEYDHVDFYLQDSIDLAEWCDGRSYMMASKDERAYEGCELVGPHISIKTLEGTHAAQPGDFIIQEFKGEFYPCKPDIFEATYEPVGNVD